MESNQLQQFNIALCLPEKCFKTNYFFRDENSYNFYDIC